MTKRTFKREKMLISNTNKLIIIGNYHTVPIQNIDFQYYHNDCNKHSKRFFRANCYQSFR